MSVSKIEIRKVFVPNPTPNKSLPNFEKCDFNIYDFIFFVMNYHEYHNQMLFQTSQKSYRLKINSKILPSFIISNLKSTE